MTNLELKLATPSKLHAELAALDKSLAFLRSKAPRSPFVRSCRAKISRVLRELDKRNK